MSIDQNRSIPHWLYKSLMDRLTQLIEENQALRNALGVDTPAETPRTEAKIVHLSPLDGYKCHIAHANHIIYNEVLHNLNDDQQ